VPKLELMLSNSSSVILATSFFINVFASFCFISSTHKNSCLGSSPNVNPAFASETTTTTLAKRASCFADVRNRRTTDQATEGLYTVVVGCKGAGKTSCVTSVFQNQNGVIFLQVNQEDTSASILKRMLKICGFVVENDLDEQLIELQKPFLIAAKDQNDRRVTIIIEVERGTDSQDVLVMVVNFNEFFLDIWTRNVLSCEFWE
jgi:hypothetical protein